METFADIITEFPDGVLATGLIKADGEPVGAPAIALWKHRNSIPSEYWVQLIALGKARRLGITLELLAGAVIKRKRAA